MIKIISSQYVKMITTSIISNLNTSNTDISINGVGRKAYPTTTKTESA